MGRSRRYRERVRFEMHSVEAKSVRGLVVRTLQQEFGRSRVEAEALAEQSLQWLRELGVPAVPGQVRLSVPASPARRTARGHRTVVTVTAVDVGEDTEIWRAYGLETLQRRRLLRWLYEIHRQGGWASLMELAAWANLTPTAAAARLACVRKWGIWLPHVAGPAPREDGLALEPWLVDRYLADGQVEALRAEWGFTLGGWEAALRRCVRVVERAEAGMDMAAVAAELNLSPLECRQLLAVARRVGRKTAWKELRSAYGSRSEPAGAGDIGATLVQHYGFSPVAARLYQQWLSDMAARLGNTPLGEGEMVFFALCADEGASARLTEARHIPVRLHFFTADDAAEGPSGQSQRRVAGLKFQRIVRYATEARNQGALLTLPDLAVLLGIHVDAIRYHLSAHPEVVVPTRGRVKDIGRGVTHRSQIVELYLQMHTETEIVQRTGHTYESVEAYLREFARMLTLADQGLNAVMIRRVTGRSMALVKAYLELYRRYDLPDYHFRLSQLRNVFTRPETAEAKKGRPFRFRTGGGGR